MPHFLAIAWLCRDDYARAGMPLLPVIQPDGRSTGYQSVLYSAVLIPISLLPTVVGLSSAYYAVGAITLAARKLVERGIARRELRVERQSAIRAAQTR